jgi:putative ABC transport system permease protein
VLIPLRARKVVRDLLAMRGRASIMVVAIAVSVAAVGAVAGARAILEREIRANYLATHPASATLALPNGSSHVRASAVRASAGGATASENATDDAEVLRIARSRPGVLDAALRTRAFGRVLLSGGRRVPLLLFVAPASDPMRVAGFTPESGHWPPAADELLLERSSIAFFGLQKGERIDIETRGGRRTSVRIGGIVHDGSVSPSSQENVAYGYATPELLTRLGQTPVLDALAIVVGEAGSAHGVRGDAGVRSDVSAASADKHRIDAVAQDVGTALRAAGVTVTRIDAPPPLRHPHQAQMETAVALLMTFAILALVLGAVLVATTIGGMLAQHIRQIGVLKTLGASDGTVLGMYLLMTAAVAAVATLLALVPSVFAARYLAALIGALFGVDVTDAGVPPSVFVAEIAAGMLVPIAVALAPLVRGTSVTVREAIDGGAHGGALFGTTRLQTWLARRTTGSRTLRLALRNVVRRPDRLLLIVALLGTSGAIYLTATSTAGGIQAVVDDAMAHKHYDVDVRLSHPEDAATVARVMRGIGDVTAFDLSSSAPVTIPNPGKIDLTRAYPDGGHGSFTIAAVDPDTTLLALPLTEGRRLRAGDDGAVVFNQVVIQQQLPGARVGQDVELSVDGRVTRLRLVGIVSDFGSPATAYVTPAGFARAGGARDGVTLVRTVTRAHDRAGRAAAATAIQRRFAAEGIALRGVVPVTQFTLALNGHAKVLADTLSALAVVMAIVGILGLGSAIGTGVLERTREFGVLRSVGASASTIAAIVMTEGLIYAVLAEIAALALCVPFTLLLDAFVGGQAFRVPLPFVIPPESVAISALVLIAGAAAVSAAGARTAARLTVREALASG